MRAAGIPPLLLAATACAAVAPGTSATNRRGIPPGTGLLAGQSGALVIDPGARTLAASGTGAAQ